MTKLFVIGLGVGFLGGLFGKGGSAIATPLLQLAGVSPFLAVASPLPATIPSTLVASAAYVRKGLYDRTVVLWSIATGLPFTILGAFASALVGGKLLLLASNLIVVGLGATFLVRPLGESPRSVQDPAAKRTLSLVVGGAVGLVSGLLANSGGFLLAPLYARTLRMPLKTAFACSLVVSAVLAVPGTLVHVSLGHVSWPVVLAFGLGSIPLAYLGAVTAVRTRSEVLERIFGAALVVLGAVGTADCMGWSLR